MVKGAGERDSRTVFTEFTVSEENERVAVMVRGGGLVGSLRQEDEFVEVSGGVVVVDAAVVEVVVVVAVVEVVLVDSVGGLSSFTKKVNWLEIPIVVTYAVLRSPNPTLGTYLRKEKVSK